MKEFRERQIPIDNIVIDWLHWKQDSWGSHEFDPERFPDPKGMVDSIHAMNGRLMISVWPKFYATTEHFKEFDEKGWIYQQAIKDSIKDWVGPGYLALSMTHTMPMHASSSGSRCKTITILSA